MTNFMLTCLAGVISTIIMTLTLYVFHWRGFANGDMVRALGSLITRKYENSFTPGIVIHLLGGVFFALFYVMVWSSFPDIRGSSITAHVVLGHRVTSSTHSPFGLVSD
jgi:glucan phosphoethanolaminetransferase (alkaline phosphatase superfamily)